MFLIPPEEKKLKWCLRFRNYNGKIVKVSADRDRATSVRIGERIEMLLRAKQHGDLPPGELAAWIDNMPELLAKRLISLGLLDVRRIQRTKPLEDQFVEYGRIVAARRSNSKRHANMAERKVRRVCEGLKIERLNDLNATALTEYLKAQTFATSTRRAYIIAMKDFAKEMKRIGALRENPFEYVKPPGQYENPEYERQPLTVAQFQKLMQHLDTFERYKHQNARWTARDRKMLFWTAVKTGYRQSELRSIVKANLHLDTSPPVVALKSKFAKNKTAGEVPIPTVLADALREYTADLEPNDKVFTMPTTSGSIVDMLRRDLKGAGVNWRLPTGEVIDFHTFRSTAITWWLTEDGLIPKKVQVLARLKTLSLVQNYSRNYKIEDFGWLNNGPTLVEPKAPGHLANPPSAKGEPNEDQIDGRSVS